MKITKYEIQKNQERVSIYIDGAYMFSVTKENFVLNDLYINKELSYDDIVFLEKQDEKARAFSYILYQLNYGMKTEKQLKLKMNSQKYSDEAQEYALKKAKKYGYVNDEEYCDSFISSHLNLNGWGKNKLYSELLKKGINKELINKKLAELCNDDDFFETAYNAALKKYNLIKNKETDKYKIKQKLYMFLSGRGYSYEIIQGVIDKIQELEG